MKKRIFVSSLLILTSITSCNWVLGIKGLGEGYFFDTDEILYTIRDSYHGSGFIVLPAKILSYNNDENFIVALSENKKGDKRFWIIFKKYNHKEIRYIEIGDEYDNYYIYSNIIGPMNESEFNAAKIKYSIPNDLKLKDI